MPNLKFVNDLLMEDILRTIGNGLRVLDIQGLKIGDETLRSISRHSKSLECLVAGSNQITDSGLICLASSCIPIVKLDIGFNPISDTGVLAVCHAFSQIRSLSVCGMGTRLSLGCIHTLTQSLCSLEVLDLRFCSNVRPEHLPSILWLNKEACEIIR